MTRGVLVHQMPHPVHAAWAGAAGLALHPWLPRAQPYLTIPGRDLAAARAVPRCGLAMAEGGGPAGACALARRLGRARRALLLAADETWARLARGVPSPLPPTEAAWWRILGRSLDGAVAVSPYVARDLQALFPGLGVRVVRPHVLPGQRERLLGLAPALEGARVLHLASTADKNGTRLLVEAWQEVRARFPGAVLDLVGAGSEGWRGEGLQAHGRVPDLAPFLEAASLFALPGLGQACPVSTLEAMTAGVPALVSDETGTADLAAMADPGLVVRPRAADVAAAVARHLAREPAERRALGLAARKAVAPLTPGAQAAAFVEAVDALARD